MLHRTELDLAILAVDGFRWGKEHRRRLLYPPWTAEVCRRLEEPSRDWAVVKPQLLKMIDKIKWSE